MSTRHWEDERILDVIVELGSLGADDNRRVVDILSGHLLAEEDPWPDDIDLARLAQFGLDAAAVCGFATELLASGDEFDHDPEDILRRLAEALRRRVGSGDWQDALSVWADLPSSLYDVSTG